MVTVLSLICGLILLVFRAFVVKKIWLSNETIHISRCHFYFTNEYIFSINNVGICVGIGLVDIKMIY